MDVFPHMICTCVIMRSISDTHYTSLCGASPDISMTSLIAGISHSVAKWGCYFRIDVNLHVWFYLGNIIMVLFYCKMKDTKMTDRLPTTCAFLHLTRRQLL